MSRKKPKAKRPSVFAQNLREALDNRKALEEEGKIASSDHYFGSQEEYVFGEAEKYLGELLSRITWRLQELGAQADDQLEFTRDTWPDWEDPVVKLCVFRDEVKKALVAVEAKDLLDLVGALVELLPRLPGPEVVTQRPTGRPRCEGIEHALWKMRTSEETTFDEAVEALPDGHSEPLVVEVGEKAYKVYRDGDELVQIGPDEEERSLSRSAARNLWTTIRRKRLLEEAESFKPFAIFPLLPTNPDLPPK